MVLAATFLPVAGLGKGRTALGHQTINKYMMRNASGDPNVRAGPADWFTIEAPRVRLEMCELSWTLDRSEESATEFRESSGLAAVVTNGSKEPLRIAVFHCDTYLVREQDFARQYDWMDEDAEHLAYLWAEPTATDDDDCIAVFGACCFRNRQREYVKGPPYAMQWIWFHPYARRKGHLTSAWPYFRKRFGAFLVETPHSDGMRRFLAGRKDYDEALEAHGLEKLVGRLDEK